VSVHTIVPPKRNFRFFYSPLKEEVKDVIGEVCNMVAGSLISSLGDSGFNCRISPPTFTLGSDFELECRRLDREWMHA